MLVYIPGGGFVGGDKNSDGVFYGNLGVYFARHGYLTIVANYRLAPANPWPAGSQDVAGAIAWARKEAEAHGGDAGRLFLFGQSAGSTHAAGYVFDPQFHPASGVGVTAAILMSGGGYRVIAQSVAQPHRLLRQRREPVRGALAHHPCRQEQGAALPAVAEYDPGMLTAPTFDLARAVSLRDGKSPQFPSCAATTTSRPCKASAAARTTWARASGSSWAGSG